MPELRRCAVDGAANITPTTEVSNELNHAGASLESPEPIPNEHTASRDLSKDIANEQNLGDKQRQPFDDRNSRAHELVEAPLPQDSSCEKLPQCTCHGDAVGSGDNIARRAESDCLTRLRSQGELYNGEVQRTWCPLHGKRGRTITLFPTIHYLILTLLVPSHRADLPHRVVLVSQNKP